MPVPAVRLKIRVKLAAGARPYFNPLFASNGKLKPHYALVGGKPQHHPEGVYHLRYAKRGKRVWEPVGSDPQLAMTAKLRVEHGLQATSLGLVPADGIRSNQVGTTDLDEAISQYLGDTAQLKSRKTHQAYSLTLKGFRIACPRPKCLEDVTRCDILLYMGELGGAGNLPRTVANRIDFLKIFFNRFKVVWPMEKTDRVPMTLFPTSIDGPT